MQKEDIKESIAYIQDGEEFFQVLNEDETGWDESATAELYEQFKVQHL